MRETIFQSFIGYKNFRYFWLAIFLSLMSILIYSNYEPTEPNNGGTWLGYGLGTIGALLILWLMYFGIRKRQYHSTAGTVKGWLSAHIYLGLSLIIIVTLHTGFQFGWNVHTLAYVLMCLVILSGVWGVYAYLRYPQLMTRNRHDLSRQQIFEQLKDLDRQTLKLAEILPSELRIMVASAVQRAIIGGDWESQLLAKDNSKIVVMANHLHKKSNQVVSNKDQMELSNVLAQALTRNRETKIVQALQELLKLTINRASLLLKLRRGIQLQAFLEIWLYIHVPLSFGLLAALVVHIFSVFIYW